MTSKQKAYQKIYQKKYQTKRVRVLISPNDLYFKLLVAKAFLAKRSKSSTAKQAVKDHFDKYTKSDIEYLLGVFSKMTPEEIAFPNKVKSI